MAGFRHLLRADGTGTEHGGDDLLLVVSQRCPQMVALIVTQCRGLDVFDTQCRFVAVAAEGIQDLGDRVVDLLGAGRLLVCFHSRLDHGFFRRGIEPRGVKVSYGEASVAGLAGRDYQLEQGVEIAGCRLLQGLVSMAGFPVGLFQLDLVPGRVRLVRNKPDPCRPPSRCRATLN